MSELNLEVINNYLKLANNSYESKNMEESIKYCNKIIEMDIKNYEAWYLKGKASGWSSSIKNNRIIEVINCWKNAFNYVSDAEKEKLEIKICKDTILLIMALIELHLNHFVDYQDITIQEFIVDTIYLLQNDNFLNIILINNENKEMLLKKIALTLENKVESAYVNIRNKYIGEGYPNDNEFKEYINNTDCCINFLKISIDLENNNIENIKKMEKIIKIHKDLIESASYKYRASYYDYFLKMRIPGGYIINLKLTEDSKKNRNEEINKYKKKIEEIDPNYNLNSNTKEGCYIATVVYGSYEANEVKVLRKFRDDTLKKLFLGRLFIKIYYKISPNIAKKLKNNIKTNKAIKEILNQIIKIINYFELKNNN